MRIDTELSRRAFVAASGFAAAGLALPGSMARGQDGASAQRKPIKIAQIGTGNQHATKIGTLRRLTDLFEVVGVAGDDPDKLGKAPDNDCYKGLPWMSQEELLAIPGLQAVAVETEERLNVPVALNCVRAGKHIHLDKPCGESLPALKQLLDEAEASRLTVQVGYMYRNNPAVQFCIKAVREGLIGNVYDLDAAMLSNPRILVANNEEAKIHVGDTVPYIISTTSGTGDNTIYSEDVRFVDVGLKLNVSATINDEGFVAMKLLPEISSVVGTIDSKGGGIPQVNKTMVETSVIVKDGTTIIMGGLKKEEKKQVRQGIPFLMDMPWIGKMFKSTSDQLTMTEIVILITPHIVTGQEHYEDKEGTVKPYKNYQ